MTGFIATESSTISGVIKNDGFFPDIDLADFASVMQIRQQISADRIRNILPVAMLHVNGRLSAIKISGETLETLQSDTINGMSQNIILYREAVYAYAKSLILEEWRNYDLTLEGASQAEQADGSIDDNRRRCTAAISALLGQTSANQVTLI